MENYEQKYKDALSWMKDLYPTFEGATKEDAEHYFPELKESEDERIRKELIHFFKNHMDSVYEEISDNNVVIAWLEASEQKLTDNVEPKFKVGDWVVHKETGMIHQIQQCVELVNTHTYGYDLTDGGYISTFKVDEYRLWTIEDAKGGDVLATSSGSVCIFDNTVEDGIYPFAYCGLTNHGFEIYNRKLPFTHDRDIHPATKEQRDQLEKTMADAGYTFDFEKKELKKINLNKAEHGKYYFCIKDYFSGGKKFASKGDVVLALRGLPIMGLKDVSEYFILVNNVHNHAWSE